MTELVAQAAPQQRLLIETSIRLRWRDLDAFNHVNNSTFLTYLEEARLLWFASIDGPWQGDAFSPVVAAVNINYRAQLKWPGRIIVELRCERLGKSSLSIAHRIVDSDNRDTLYSDGNVVLVWIDPTSGMSVAVPESLRRASQ